LPASNSAATSGRFAAAGSGLSIVRVPGGSTVGVALA
jgi:hypothetical protein